MYNVNTSTFIKGYQNTLNGILIFLILRTNLNQLNLYISEFKTLINIQDFFMQLQLTLYYEYKYK